MAIRLSLVAFLIFRGVPQNMEVVKAVESLSGICIVKEWWFGMINHRNEAHSIQVAIKPFSVSVSQDPSQLMVNCLFWGPVVWISGIPLWKGGCYLRVPLECQTAGPQTNNEPSAESLCFCRLWFISSLWENFTPRIFRKVMGKFIISRLEKIVWG